ncbi:phosphatidylserine decarboxylase [Helicobacter cappadocius]|uniref:phosphatidylserine decarboxylase n=1 Tax=Helicobacter cappadocius TaxID=3063998 RepID=A0AA90PSM8_9HELI|nr:MULTISPECIES: phosphatidylserine decarboxylase [unclassified Helicobacter]MDO7253485.1 phosphatidylserine decarboxylase [Helicobacter sp. faydin-H75]MDP2539412.1 phosphatidylserine decarboxylase [Helicobacter sp. faydin-H76]
MAFNNKVSRLFGKFANHSFPSIIQKIINSIYVRIFKIDMSEFGDISSYGSLNALFTRSLCRNRAIDFSKDVLISPCDSLITECSKIQNDTALQIKGMSYRVSELLGERDGLQEEYLYINFYLSPKDYHRYHAPCDMEVLQVRYFGGELLPVNKPSLKKNSNLFIKNERVVLVCRDIKGEIMYFVAVGALNVGKMVLHFESRVETNTTANQNIVYHYEIPKTIKKGDELGMFKMGSTVVMFIKNIKNPPLCDTKVRFGDSVGQFV